MEEQTTRRVDDVRNRTDEIHGAADAIELLIVDVDDPDDWRAILGFVEAASRRTYSLRKRLLDEAIARSDRRLRAEDQLTDVVVGAAKGEPR